MLSRLTVPVSVLIVVVPATETIPVKVTELLIIRFPLTEMSSPFVVIGFEIVRFLYCLPAEPESSHANAAKAIFVSVYSTIEVELLVIVPVTVCAEVPAS